MNAVHLTILGIWIGFVLLLIQTWRTRDRLWAFVLVGFIGLIAAISGTQALRRADTEARQKDTELAAIANKAKKSTDNKIDSTHKTVYDVLTEAKIILTIAKDIAAIQQSADEWAIIKEEQSLIASYDQLRSILWKLDRTENNNLDSIPLNHFLRGVLNDLSIILSREMGNRNLIPNGVLQRPWKYTYDSLKLLSGKLTTDMPTPIREVHSEISRLVSCLQQRVYIYKFHTNGLRFPPRDSTFILNGGYHSLGKYSFDWPLITWGGRTMTDPYIPPAGWFD